MPGLVVFRRSLLVLDRFSFLEVFFKAHLRQLPVFIGDKVCFYLLVVQTIGCVNLNHYSTCIFRFWSCLFSLFLIVWDLWVTNVCFTLLKCFTFPPSFGLCTFNQLCVSGIWALTKHFSISHGGCILEVQTSQKVMARTPYSGLFFHTKICAILYYSFSFSLSPHPSLNIFYCISIKSLIQIYEIAWTLQRNMTYVRNQQGKRNKKLNVLCLLLTVSISVLFGGFLTSCQTLCTKKEIYKWTVALS